MVDTSMIDRETRRLQNWRLSEAASVEGDDYFVMVTNPATSPATNRVPLSLIRGGITTPNLTGNSYTVLDGDFVIIIDDDDVDVSATVVVALPAAADSENRMLYIKKIGSSYSVQLNPDGAELIDDVAYLNMNSQYDCLCVVCDGSAWWTL